MSVAILIVNYRAYDALDRCLASLTPFLSDDDEVIIVDHESDEPRLQTVAAKCPRAVAIPRYDNPGFAAGVNRAAAVSRAPYLLLLNPDTELCDAVPRKLESWLAAHPDAGVVGPRVLNLDGSVQPTARRFPGVTTVVGGRSTWFTRRFPNNWLTRWNLTGRDVNTPLAVDWISGACLMTTRALFDRLGGFDESFFLYSEDIDYCRRALGVGYRSVYVPVATVRHQVGASAEHAVAQSIWAFHDSAFRYYWKHAGVAGRAVAPVVWLGLRIRGAWRLHCAQRS
jgi:GT2 family glycosyltransferase